MAKKILIIGTGYLRNYGCEAIVQGTYRIIKEAGIECDIYVASDDIQYDSAVLPKDIHLIPYKQRFTFHRLWRGFLRRVLHIGNGSPVLMNPNIGKKFDVVLASGGDNYCEAPDGTLYNILTNLMTIGERAKQAHKKYVLWGASVGPFREDNAKKVLANLSKCDLITVREQLAYKYVKEHGLGNKLHLVADPAFMMPADNNIKFLQQEKHLYLGLNISLLSISHCIIEQQNQFISKLFSILDDILSTHPLFHIVCIPHVVLDDQMVQNDRMFMSQYLTATKHPDRVTMLPEGIGAQKTKGYIGKMDILIAARMHCCVAGISMGTPTLFITYSNKGKGMSHYAYGHHNYELSVEEIISPLLISKIETMLSQAIDIREHLEQQKEKFKVDAMRGGRLLFTILQ